MRLKNDLPFMPVVIWRIIVWITILALGISLLYGRYNWEGQSQQGAMQGFLSSAYMFALFLPTLYYTLFYFTKHLTLTRFTTALFGIIFTLPYQWLGLGKYYYYANREAWFVNNSSNTTSGAPQIQLDWFPGAWSRLPAIPYETSFFTVLLFIGIIIAVLCWRHGPNSFRMPHNQYILLWLCIYFLILLQTWLHLSMRSPYTYLAHYERSPDQNYWYHGYLFPNFSGAVNADYPVFRSLEEYFIGDTRSNNYMLIRRAAFFYFTGQFSYFIHTMYVSLFFNIALWMATTVSGYLFARKLINERVGIFVALFIASGTGFIVYVAQPMTYLPGFCIIMILIYLFDELFVLSRCVSHIILFSLLMSIGLLIYDIMSIYVFFILYALIKKANLKLFLIILILPLLLYSGFIYLQLDILKIFVDPSNVKEAMEPFEHIKKLIAYPDFIKLYVLSLPVLSMFIGHLLKAFFILPILLAVVGLFLLDDMKKSVIILSMIFPSLITLAYMHYGGTHIAAFPRFTYAAYPGIFILAAVALNKIAHFHLPRIPDRLFTIAPWVIIFGVFILNNIDVFGFGMMYYYFYHTAISPWPI